MRTNNTFLFDTRTNLFSISGVNVTGFELVQSFHVLDYEQQFYFVLETTLVISR